MTHLVHTSRSRLSDWLNTGAIGFVRQNVQPCVCIDSVTACVCIFIPLLVGLSRASSPHARRHVGFAPSCVGRSLIFFGLPLLPRRAFRKPDAKHSHLRPSNLATIFIQPQHTHKEGRSALGSLRSRGPLLRVGRRVRRARGWRLRGRGPGVVASSSMGIPYDPGNGNPSLRFLVWITTSTHTHLWGLDGEAPTTGVAEKISGD